MSIFGLIEKRSSLANPDRFLLGLFGGQATDAGVMVNEDNAMTYTSVYACVQVISEAMGTLPLNLYRRGKTGGRELIMDLPISRLLNLSPNQEMAAMSFKATVMGWVLTWGNGYAEIERNRAGFPIALHPIAPNRVVPQRRRGDYRIQYLITRTAMTSPYSMESVIADSHIDRDDMFHMAGLGFDGIMGYNPIRMSKQAVGLGLAAESYGGRFFGNSGVPSGVLKSAKPIKDPEKLRKQWTQANGAGNQRGTAVLEDGVEWASIGIPPEDSQFLETRKFQRSEIAGIYRVPPHMIGDLERSTNNNIEHQGSEFVTYCLGGWLARMKGEANRKLLTPAQLAAGYYYDFDTDELLKGDRKTRYEAYATARQWGWMSADDVREKENLPDLPDGQGKTYLIPMNMIPAKLAENHPKLEASDPSKAPAPLPPGKDAAPAKEGGEGAAATGQDLQTSQDTVLNGAQISAATEIVALVSAGGLPRDAGLGQLQILFNLSKEQAEQMMGPAGTGQTTTPDKPKGGDPEPAPAPTDGARRVDPAKLRASFRASLLEAATRAVHKETLAIRRAAKKPEAFAATVREFYGSHGDHLRTVLIPAATTFSELYDKPFTAARDAVNRVAEVMVRQSVADLASPKLDVEHLMQNWDAGRPVEIADTILKEIGV